MKRLVSMIILTSVTLMTVLGSVMFDGTEAEAKSNKTHETSVNAGASLVFSNTLELTEKHRGLVAGVPSILADSLSSIRIEEIIIDNDNVNINAGMARALSNTLNKENLNVSVERKEITIVTEAPAMEQIEEPVLSEREKAEINNNDIYSGTGNYIVIDRSFDSISEEEFDLLCHLVMGEAEGENDDAQIAVAEVVLNRVESGEFPNTIYEVIWQRNPVQFSPTVDGRINIMPTDRCKENVKKALLEVRYPKEMLFFTSINYTKGYIDYKKIDDMYFSLYYGGK